MRLFLAIDLPTTQREALKEIMRSCQAIFGSSARYSSADDLHITLKFLGEMDETDCELLLLELAPRLLSAKQFELHLSHAGIFSGPSGSPRVAWLGVESQPLTALQELQALSSEVAEAFGVAPDSRPFSGHLTLARFRGVPPPSCIPRFLQLKAAPLPFPISQVTLYESLKSASGARYSAKSVLPLS